MPTMRWFGARASSLAELGLGWLNSQLPLLPNRAMSISRWLTGKICQNRQESIKPYSQLGRGTGCGTHLLC
eukprot:16434569-Heterocapsa_arctica.AAC.1